MLENYDSLIELLILIFIIIVILHAIRMIYRFYRNSKYKNLGIDISTPDQESNIDHYNENQNNDRYSYFLYKKLSEVEEKLDRNFYCMILTLIIVIIGIPLTIYLTYRWTYLINPDNINKAADSILDTLDNAFTK